MSDLVSSDLDDDMKNSWGTDPDVFNAMDKEFNFSLDAAASNSNYLCEWYLTKEDNALEIDWVIAIQDHALVSKTAVWVNPPYGRGYIQKFMNKAIEQKAKGVTTVMLVPATLDAQWLPLHSISEIRVVTGGRLSFYHPVTGKKVNGNTKGSMFVIFRPSSMPFFIRLIDRNELLSLGTTEVLAA
jgi:phage N-6-adenine-methyltransferase